MYVELYMDSTRGARGSACALPRLWIEFRMLRAAGLAFGILRGVVVVALFVLFMRQTTVEDPTEPADPMQDSIRGARTYPIYDGVASGLEAILPQARQRARDIIDRREGESAPIPPAEPDQGAETPSN